MSMCLLAIAPVTAQIKQQPTVIVKSKELTDQIHTFYRLLKQSNIAFIYPKGFVEIVAPNSDDYPFDYALAIPGKDFEIWFQIKPLKQDWASFIKNPQLANPDSSYAAQGKAMAATLSGDPKYFITTIPGDILTRYNADAGKTYLVNLLDLPETKHYKYALLITLQRYHTSMIVAVCLSNQKGPEFFKNINKAANCLKFKN